MHNNYNNNGLQVTNAIRNSLQFNPSGQSMDGTMGISIALSPTQGNPAFTKDAITNASFRAKKLPGSYNKILLCHTSINMQYQLKIFEFVPSTF